MRFSAACVGSRHDDFTVGKRGDQPGLVDRHQPVWRGVIGHVPRQIEFSRLNLAYALTSKRKLALANHQRILVAGGGGFNSFLCEQIAQAIEPLQLEIAAPDIIAYKEAVLMGLAGALRWQEQPNVLPSVTGASRAAVGGAIHWGKH